MLRLLDALTALQDAVSSNDQTCFHDITAQAARSGNATVKPRCQPQRLRSKRLESYLLRKNLCASLMPVSSQLPHAWVLGKSAHIRLGLCEDPIN